jgi:hypothetical protein
MTLTAEGKELLEKRKKHLEVACGEINCILIEMDEDYILYPILLDIVIKLQGLLYGAH